MTDPAMLQRIHDADIYTLGFAYCKHVGLPWLCWPLGSMPYDNAGHLRAIVHAVASAPVCKRTEAECWRELWAIDNPGLARVLATIEDAKTKPSPSDPTGDDR